MRGVHSWLTCSCVLFRSVFVFNQKAAYEVRISAWSSDVCASDPARAPGMQGIDTPIAMRRAPPAAAEDRLRENYGQAIRVWPATDQPIGFPIVLIEPDDPLNHVALGYDMYSEPARRAAMRRA